MSKRIVRAKISFMINEDDYVDIDHSEVTEMIDDQILKEIEFDIKAAFDTAELGNININEIEFL